MTYNCRSKKKIIIRDREITLESRTEGAQDSEGFHAAATWSEVRTLWAAIKHRGGNEILQDAKLTEIVTTEFNVDYIGVTDLLAAANRNEYRILYDSVYYNILSVIDVNEMHQDVIIKCERGTEP